MHVKKGDLVEVIAGKDKGRQGKVIAAYPNTRRVLVEGVNLVKKHTKITQGVRGAQSGGIQNQEAPIHISNVMLIDPEAKERTRVGHRSGEQGDKIRISRRTGKEI
ncbi:MAG: 50S ribosomal protein L24 [Streptosporangiales bacterium]|nr:50S ribosomal protein L24 [Streptosporangiales bacterium]